MELVFFNKKYEQSDDQSGHILGLCKGHEKANYSFWMFSTNALCFFQTLEHWTSSSLQNCLMHSLAPFISYVKINIVS